MTRPKEYLVTWPLFKQKTAGARLLSTSGIAILNVVVTTMLYGRYIQSERATQATG